VLWFERKGLFIVLVERQVLKMKVQIVSLIITVKLNNNVITSYFNSESTNYPIVETNLRVLHIIRSIFFNGGKILKRIMLKLMIHQ
jgi:hypothetical protein